MRLQTREGDIYTPRTEPLLHLRSVALQELDGDTGIALLEGFQYSRHPAQGNARICPYPDRPSLESPGQRGLLRKSCRRLDYLPNERSQALPLRRETNSAVPAYKQRKTRLLLQRIDDVRDAGLRISQGFRSLRYASKLRRGKQRRQFYRVHILSPLILITFISDIIISLFTNINTYVTF